MSKFWNWISEEETEVRELRIEGPIAETTWFDDEVTPEIFRNELNSGSGPITVWINSPGGDCVAASSIYTMLMDYPYDVTAKIDGMAASAASVIAMAASRVLMSPTAIMMIHNPLTMAYGNRDDMKQAIKMLDEVKESIINAYEIKTGQPRAKIAKLMDDETWMSAQKALELGFCDEIIGKEKEKCGNEESLFNNYSFSAVAAANSLVEKLQVKNEEPKDTREAQTEEPVADNRVSIDELYNRLNGIKYN